MIAYKRERFDIRCIGTDYVPDFFQGNPEKAVRPNICAYTNSEEAGRNIVEMFDGLATTDTNRTKIKMGTAAEHEGFLRTLQEEVIAAGNMISRQTINRAVGKYCEENGIHMSIRPVVKKTTHFEVLKS